MIMKSANQELGLARRLFVTVSKWILKFAKKQKILSRLCCAEGLNSGVVTLISSPQDLLHSTADQSHLLLAREQRRAKNGPE